MTAEPQNLAEPFRRVTPEQARELIESGSVKVYDVREPGEYAQGHIPGARLVPLGKIISNAAELIQEDNILFVCEVGQRSAVAAEFAAALGRQDLYNLEGGTGAWREKGFPIDR
ncbi:MAG: rhodanese-like domain-containing protein [Chloroflexi bacterium]|nr:rhodanese-like domain-containing protein [Chloroflexota bacterium]